MKLPSRHYSQDLRKYYRLPAVRVSLTLVLSVFVMTIFIVFALRPTINSIVTLRNTIAESEKTLAQLDLKVLNLQKASAQLEALASFLPILNTNIPNNGAQYSPLTRSFDLLSLETGTLIQSDTLGPTLLFSRILSPFAPSKKQTVVALPFTIRVSGSYAGTSSYLTKLLSMERILMVETITITRESTSEADGGGEVSLNIGGSAYYLADDEQLQTAIAEVKGTP